MIVGIYSPVPQSGKSTVSKLFVEAGFERLSFAEPVKQSLEPVLTGLQIPDYKEYLYGSMKDEIIPVLGVTGGVLMSTYATNFMRNTIHPDTWLNILLNKVEPGKDYVVDDLRFPNEFAIFDITIKLYRPSRIIKGHSREKSSEGQLDNLDFSYILVNDGTQDELKLRTESLIQKIKGY